MSAAEIVDGVVTAEDELASRDLVPYTPKPMNLFGADSPAEVVAQATAYADALAAVLEQKKLYVTIQGKRHVLVEGWSMLGSMLGVFPVLEHAEPVEFDGVKGWQATVAAQTRNGDVVGRATALCLRSENRWRSADDYAVLSMAQTRATSKCLRAPLGFIVQLAGFAPTPESEMPAEVSAPSAAAAVPDGTTPPNRRTVDESTPKSTDAQRRKYRATLGELEKDFPRSDGRKWEDGAKAWMRKEFGGDSTTALSRDQMSKLIERVNEHLESERIPFGDAPAEVA